MSHSYKKTPRSGDKKDGFFKTYANRRFRHMGDAEAQHNAYKKTFCCYDICDYQTVGLSFEQYYRNICSHRSMYGVAVPTPTKEAAYQDYLKMYLRK